MRQQTIRRQPVGPRIADRAGEQPPGARPRLLGGDELVFQAAGHDVLPVEKVDLAGVGGRGEVGEFGGAAAMGGKRSNRLE